MARANLRVQEDLTQAFIAAQDTDKHVRFIQATIADESITFVKQGMIGGNAAEDFQREVVPLVNSTDSTFFLFALDTTTGGHKSWVLVTFVPEMTPVRNKMLYSSSRDDLKKSLGVGFFVGEYSSNDPQDASFEALQSALSKDMQDAPLTDLEKLKLEEKAMEKDTSIRSTAMGVVPFPLDDDLKAKLLQLNGGEEGSAWVELVIDLQAERVRLGHSKSTSLDQADIPTDCARFFAVKVMGQIGLCLVYSCPDAAPIREKMTYSTIKATVLAEALAVGVAFPKVVEIRDACDLDQLALGQGGQDSSSGPGDMKHNLNHAKPARPGKGKARLIKKNSLDDLEST